MSGVRLLDKQLEERVQHVFDSYCKRVLKNAANDYYEEVARRSKHEILLEDCWGLPCTRDQYSCDARVYQVFGVDIPIVDGAVVDALEELPPTSQIIVLASCCVGLPDRVVAERLNLVRRTVAYRRSRALLELRRILSNE